MGRVWRALDEILDRLVAVKEMRIDGLDPEDTRTRRERTLREARATARIDHPNVVRVYDVVDEGERLWIVMELVAGRSLERIMAEEGPLGPCEAARIGLGLVAALHRVHARGVLHRDIKPGNVLVESEVTRGRGRVVLTDFGIAAIQDAKALTMVGMLVGSPDYMAPERISGRPQGPPSDIWSLGATLSAALAGRSPFSRDTTLATLHAVLYEEPELPPTAGPLRDLLAALLEKEPSHRPGLDELETALEPVAFPEPTPTVPVVAAGVPRHAVGERTGEDTAPAPEEDEGGSREPRTQAGPGRMEAGGPAAGRMESGGPAAGPLEPGGPTAGRMEPGGPEGGRPHRGPAPVPGPGPDVVRGPEPEPVRASDPEPVHPGPPAGSPGAGGPPEPARTPAHPAGPAPAAAVPAHPDPRRPATEVRDAIPPTPVPTEGDARPSAEAAPSAAAALSGTEAGPSGTEAGPSAIEPAPSASTELASGPLSEPRSQAPAEPRSQAPSDLRSQASSEAHSPAPPEVRSTPPPGDSAASPVRRGGVSLARSDAVTERRPAPEPELVPGTGGSYAPMPPGELPGPAVPARPRRGRRRTGLVASVGIVAAGAVVAVVLATDFGAPKDDDRARSSVSPSATAESSPGSGPSATVEGTSRPRSLPPGAHREAGGFAWATPEGWRRNVKTGSEVHYTSPDGMQELAAKSSLARGDLMDSWQESERNARQGRDYSKIRLERTTFRGRPAVVWEYTFTLQGEPWHAQLLGFTVGGKSYQVNTWYRPDIEAQALATYEKVRDSFTVL
ncbi:protein kinase [Streptomyces sp. NPDC007808]|uniref:serine/threonine-protein kinase n=1 Tax=Streptomyces sp. NPDC007808 TaxID=3364779 RepID=UPI0036A75A4A